jgi:hypothetical protein
LNELVDFDDIQQGGHAIEGDFDYVISNSIASTILNIGGSNF